MSDLKDLSLLLYTNSRLLIQAFQLRLKELELTYPQYLTLSVLWEEDGQYVNQIGEKLELDSGTLTPLIKKLESQNYVKRIRSEADERKIKVELTYPGKSLQSKVETIIQNLEAEFEQIDSLDISKLNKQLQDLFSELKTAKK
ncbi:MAG TPA: MarR family transcriptional regulator [Algoriphagus sp.]|jgi:DNA-binding MarR family transcriptional regulator|uniref:MarR family winged helix-turn-helix transcriptional regulator n=1 Tax=unclassified Algoriphagus TaxID=2641541 RepID=UPI000C5D7523|nr:MULTISPECIES: MarR family transcriptional regulator [unclassified Algoriphagus]MAL15260.1 MarR family transcriptional regulator [Algoriphagus sp.]MAN87426.1 MarR family transcriptional regulator [Algoriphagus sp.]HAD50672.1 MarR family transcriptional regulator [Algoriphagus sp.]HAH36777.1 MarR family transcriptional regulator [Algoriphagus sp.]HAS61001.1 MarR family transcriptional regulator [Algoriphagus sp.]|tara:strand:+ start:2827 stop:3255 length:429 start_codon:yes stop_codon:yes gene_type:complete